LPASARSLSRFLSRDAAPTIALTVALLELRNRQGHSYALIDEFAGQPLPLESEEAAPTLPPRGEWLAALTASGLVGDGSGDEPLVLAGNDKLRFARFHDAEQRIWQGIDHRLGRPPDEDGLAGLEPLVRQLFGPPPEGAGINWQAVAAVSALRHRFCVITGGPGTGKTFTVARVLALLLTHDPGLRLALAAPTGKAANRLTESIRGQLHDLPLPEEIKARLGAEAKTIHRLLDYHPVTDSFRFNSERKLDADVLIVDEASMVGLLLMDGLFRAMPENSRIIILGDEYQLPSVDAGDLLAEICREAEKDASPLRDAVIRLRHSYRFGKDSGIGLLTEAVRVGDTAKALEILASDEYPEVTRMDLPERPEEILESVIPFLEAYLETETPEATLDKLNEFRLLTATRVGRWGSIRLNVYFETWLRRSGLIGPGRHYHRQPVMVTANDYQTNLFNGDVGVCWPDQGRIKVCFPAVGGELRRIPLSKLPPHEPAWALTVHKSQGSEFESVNIITASSEFNSLDNRLLYTGISRAITSVSLYAVEERIPRVCPWMNGNKR
jgi:exodeoxyribonuclease V alpha subunit